MVAGTSVVTVEDFQRHTQVRGAASSDPQATIALFWQYVESSDQDRRMKLVHWVSWPGLMVPCRAGLQLLVARGMPPTFGCAALLTLCRR